MKTKYLVILFTMLLFSGSIFVLETEAQTAWGLNNAFKITVGDDLVIVNKGTLHNTDSLVSNAFQVSEYNNGSFYTSPPGFQFVLGGTGVKKVGCIFQGSYVNSTTSADWTNIDTFMVADSAATVTASNPNINNKHYPWYRFVFRGESTNGTATTFIARMYWWMKRLNL